MAIEKCVYLIVRLALVAVGLFWIIFTLTNHYVAQMLLCDKAMPHDTTLLYYNLPSPPPLVDRLPGILWSVAAGLLFCVPNRWTQRGYLFWPRLTADSVLCSILIRRALENIHDWVPGANFLVHPSITSSVMAIVVVLAVPLSLLWRRRLDHFRPPSIGRSVSVDRPCGVAAS